MRTKDERIAAVARLGFTERQARFLVHVMLFSGICLPRQYARSAGIAYGHNVTEFFARLVRDGDATAWRSLHNRGRSYHVRGRRLYEAIGEPRHRYRRPVPARQISERLMRLDALLAQPKVQWLVSEGEKVDYLHRLAPALSTEGLSHVSNRAGARGPRLLPRDVLVGIGESKPTFVYVATRANEDDWRRAIVGHGHLLAALPAWVLRAYFPPELKAQLSRFHFVFQEELGEPLSPTILKELRWYFEQLRAPTPRTAPADRERFRECQVQLLITPRYRLLHQRWLAHGDAAFDVASSSANAQHLAKHSGQLHCLLLPVSYRNTAALVTPDPKLPTRIEGVEQGDDGSERSQPPSDYSAVALMRSRWETDALPTASQSAEAQ